jgi:nucleoside-diphosphate-sugar epimerase
VACGDRTSNAEVLGKLQEVYPYAQHHTAPWRAGDVMHTQADISKTTAVLGYVPLVRFWDGLDRTIEWYEKSWDKIKDM